VEYKGVKGEALPRATSISSLELFLLTNSRVMASAARGRDRPTTILLAERNVVLTTHTWRAVMLVGLEGGRAPIGVRSDMTGIALRT
jgi:hypothetical protein